MIKKLTAIITTASFVFSFIAGPAAAGVVEQKREAKEFRALLDDFVIPHTAGRITGGKWYGSRKVVVNIQDLHCHPEVQRNISRILGSLDERYRLKKVYVEGAAGAVDTSWLLDLKDKELKKEIVESLVEQGKLTGSEYYSISAGKPELLYGLEDESVYKANFERLNRIMDRKSIYAKTLDAMRADLEVMKDRHFNAKNRKLEAIIAKYRDGSLQPDKYYRMLGKYTEKLNDNAYELNNISNIRLDSCPNITAYLELNDLGRKLNYKRIARQLQEFVLVLKQKLPFNAYNFLLAKTDNFARLDELYIYLTRISREYNLDLTASYPDLNAFFAYVEKGQNVNPLSLVKEEKILLEEVRTAFAQDVSELEVSFVADFFSYFDDYLNNRLSAEDYEYFSQRFSEFRLQWAKYADADRIKTIEADLPLLEAYYQANVERNRSFIKNSLGEYRNPESLPAGAKTGVTDAVRSMDGAEEVMVVVTGGFHTQGLENLLDERKISYLSITPNVTRDTKTSDIVYQELARQQALILRQSFALMLLSKFGPAAKLGAIMGVKMPLLAKTLLSNRTVQANIEKKLTRAMKQQDEVSETTISSVMNEVSGIWNTNYAAEMGQVTYRYHGPSDDGREHLFVFTVKQPNGIEKPLFFVCDDAGRVRLAEQKNDTTPQKTFFTPATASIGHDWVRKLFGRDPAAYATWVLVASPVWETLVFQKPGMQLINSGDPLLIIAGIGLATFGFALAHFVAKVAFMAHEHGGLRNTQLPLILKNLITRSDLREFLVLSGAGLAFMLPMVSINAARVMLVVSFFSMITATIQSVRAGEDGKDLRYFFPRIAMVLIMVLLPQVVTTAPELSSMLTHSVYNFLIFAGIAPAWMRMASIGAEENGPKIERIDEYKLDIKNARNVSVMGDIHANYDEMLSALRNSNLISAKGDWIGGKRTLVLAGDLIDKGEHPWEVMTFLYHLSHQAAAAGGALVVVRGEHDDLMIKTFEGDARSLDQWVEVGGIGTVKALFGSNDTLSDRMGEVLINMNPNQRAVEIPAFIEDLRQQCGSTMCGDVPFPDLFDWMTTFAYSVRINNNLQVVHSAPDMEAATFETSLCSARSCERSLWDTNWIRDDNREKNVASIERYKERTGIRHIVFGHSIIDFADGSKQQGVISEVFPGIYGIATVNDKLRKGESIGVLNYSFGSNGWVTSVSTVYGDNAFGLQKEEFPLAIAVEVDQNWNWWSKIDSNAARWKPEFINRAMNAGLTKENLLVVLKKMNIAPADVKYIKINMAQEGPSYGVFRADISLMDDTKRYFGIDIVVNPESEVRIDEADATKKTLNDYLQLDHANLSYLRSIGLPLGMAFTPETYVLTDGSFDIAGEQIKMKFMAVEWFKEHIELHYGGSYFYTIPNYLEERGGRRGVDFDAARSEIVRHELLTFLALIYLASYEEGKGGMVIRNLSINNGDFVVRDSDSALDAHLITARKLERVGWEGFLTYLREHEHILYTETKITNGNVDVSRPTFTLARGDADIRRAVDAAFAELQKRTPEKATALKRAFGIEPSGRSVEELAKEAIAKAGGKISFQDYIRICLYSEQGYYSGGTVEIGKKKHFITCPEEYPKRFGATLAYQINQMWENMGKPKGYRVVEMGAGNGTMALSTLDSIALQYPELYQAMTYTIVEISPELMKRQKATLAAENGKVEWVNASALDLPMQPFDGIFLSNELPDAFPVHLVHPGQNGTFTEEMVTCVDDAFRPVQVPVTDPAVQEYLGHMAEINPEMLKRKDVIVNTDMQAWQKAMASRLRRGYVISIDYGYYDWNPHEDLPLLRIYGDETVASRSEYYAHPEKYIYGIPGGVDFTTDIDFRVTAAIGEKNGLHTEGVMAQNDFFAKLDPFLPDVNLESMDQIIRRSDKTPGMFHLMVQSKGVERAPLSGLGNAHIVRILVEAVKSGTIDEKTALLFGKLDPREQKDFLERLVYNSFGLDTEHWAETVRLIIPAASVTDDFINMLHDLEMATRDNTTQDMTKELMWRQILMASINNPRQVYRAIESGPLNLMLAALIKGDNTASASMILLQVLRSKMKPQYRAALARKLVEGFGRLADNANQDVIASFISVFEEAVKSFDSAGRDERSTVYRQVVAAVERNMADGVVLNPAVQELFLMIQKRAQVVNNSPDMAVDAVSHEVRNALLEKQIEQNRVYRARSGKNKITLEHYDPRYAANLKDLSALNAVLLLPQRLISWVVTFGDRLLLRRNVEAKLINIRSPGGALDNAVKDATLLQELQLDPLAQALNTTPQELLKKLIDAAKSADIFIVKDRLTLHGNGGPFAHARRGNPNSPDIRKRTTGIWMGEKLFTEDLIANTREKNYRDIVLILLEEAKHLVAPELDHDVIIHSKDLQERLKFKAVELNEVTAEQFADGLSCPFDMGSIRSDKTPPSAAAVRKMKQQKKRRLYFRRVRALVILAVLVIAVKAGWGALFPAAPVVNPAVSPYATTHVTDQTTQPLDLHGIKPQQPSASATSSSLISEFKSFIANSADISTEALSADAKGKYFNPAIKDRYAAIDSWINRIWETAQKEGSLDPFITKRGNSPEGVAIGKSLLLIQIIAPESFESMKKGEVSFVLGDCFGRYGYTKGSRVKGILGSPIIYVDATLNPGIVKKAITIVHEGLHAERSTRTVFSYIWKNNPLSLVREMLFSMSVHEEVDAFGVQDQFVMKLNIRPASGDTFHSDIDLTAAYNEERGMFLLDEFLGSLIWGIIVGGIYEFRNILKRKAQQAKQKAKENRGSVPMQGVVIGGGLLGTGSAGAPLLSPGSSALTTAAHTASSAGWYMVAGIALGVIAVAAIATVIVRSRSAARVPNAEQGLINTMWAKRHGTIHAAEAITGRPEELSLVDADVLSAEEREYLAVQLESWGKASVKYSVLIADLVEWLRAGSTKALGDDGFVPRFVIASDGTVQGVMQYGFIQAEGEQTLKLYYFEAAPWNRAETADRRFKGIGSQMLYSMLREAGFTANPDGQMPGFYMTVPSEDTQKLLLRYSDNGSVPLTHMIAPSYAAAPEGYEATEVAALQDLYRVEPAALKYFIAAQEALSADALAAESERQRLDPLNAATVIRPLGAVGLFGGLLKKIYSYVNRIRFLRSAHPELVQGSFYHFDTDLERAVSLAAAGNASGYNNIVVSVMPDQSTDSTLRPFCKIRVQDRMAQVVATVREHEGQKVLLLLIQPVEGIDDAALLAAASQELPNQIRSSKYLYDGLIKTYREARILKEANLDGINLLPVGVLEQGKLFGSLDISGLDRPAQIQLLGAWMRTVNAESVVKGRHLVISMNWQDLRNPKNRAVYAQFIRMMGGSTVRLRGDASSGSEAQLEEIIAGLRQQGLSVQMDMRAELYSAVEKLREALIRRVGSLQLDGASLDLRNASYMGRQEIESLLAEYRDHFPDGPLALTLADELQTPDMRDLCARYGTEIVTSVQLSAGRRNVSGSYVRLSISDALKKQMSHGKGYRLDEYISGVQSQTVEMSLEDLACCKDESMVISLPNAAANLWILRAMMTETPGMMYEEAWQLKEEDVPSASLRRSLRAKIEKHGFLNLLEKNEQSLSAEVAKMPESQLDAFVADMKTLPFINDRTAMSLKILKTLSEYGKTIDEKRSCVARMVMYLRGTAERSIIAENLERNGRKGFILPGNAALFGQVLLRYDIHMNTYLGQQERLSPEEILSLLRALLALGRTDDAQVLMTKFASMYQKTDFMKNGSVDATAVAAVLEFTDIVCGNADAVRNRATLGYGPAFGFIGEALNKITGMDIGQEPSLRLLYVNAFSTVVKAGFTKYEKALDAQDVTGMLENMAQELTAGRMNNPSLIRLLIQSLENYNGTELSADEIYQLGETAAAQLRSAASRSKNGLFAFTDLLAVLELLSDRRQLKKELKAEIPDARGFLAMLGAA